VNLEDQILALDAAKAETLLQTFSSAQNSASTPLQLDSALRGELEAAFELDSSREVTATKGDLARAALILLAQHSDHREGISALVAASPPRQFVPVIEAAVLVPAVLIVLQTHIKFERDLDGRWSLKMEKKPTDNALLKDLVKKLLSFI
jgi:hypothetical protein